MEKVSGLAYLQIEIDRDKIARYGINVANVQEVVETAIGGKEATKLYEGQKVFGLAVRFQESARSDVSPIRRNSYRLARRAPSFPLASWRTFM